MARLFALAADNDDVDDEWNQRVDGSEIDILVDDQDLPPSFLAAVAHGVMELSRA